MPTVFETKTNAAMQANASTVPSTVIGTSTTTINGTTTTPRSGGADGRQRQGQATATVQAMSDAAMVTGALTSALTLTGSNKPASAARLLATGSRCRNLVSPPNDPGPEVVEEGADWYHFVLPDVLPSMGGSTAAGALLLTTLFGLATACAVIVMAAVASMKAANSSVEQQPSPMSTTSSRVFATALALFLSFYAPNITEAAVGMTRRPQWAPVAIAVGCLVANSAAFFGSALLFTLWWPRNGDESTKEGEGSTGGIDDPPPGTSQPSDTSDFPSSSRCVALISLLQRGPMRTLIDGCRDERVVAIRVVNFVDMFSAHLLAILAAVRPSTVTGCVVVLGGMTIVPLAYLVYLIALRPLTSFIEGATNVATVTLTATLGAVLAVGAASVDMATGASNSTAEAIAGIIQIVLNVAFYVQLLLLAGVELHEHCLNKRRNVRRSALGDQEQSVEHASTAVALLNAPLDFAVTRSSVGLQVPLPHGWLSNDDAVHNASTPRKDDPPSPPSLLSSKPSNPLLHRGRLASAASAT